MKIYFSPEYSGQVFIRPDKGNVQMDTKVVNTIGLINLLELRLGLYYQEMSQQELTILYYKSMKRYVEENPGDILSDSFKLAGLSTARTVLGWRDALKMAQWKFCRKGISRRLNSIIGIEEIFSKECGPDLADRILIVTKKLNAVRPDCSRLELIMPYECQTLQPILRQLIEALQGCGAKIEQLPHAPSAGNNLGKIRKLVSEEESEKIELNSKDKDDSFLIYRFEDEHAACAYLAAKGDELADVWINPDNKQMDNWLSLLGKPLTGSVMANCSPRITQLFELGIGLFSIPLNIETLIEWLNMPLHPIDKRARMKLAYAIVREGGYRNDKCKEIIESYIAGEYVCLGEEDKMLSEEEQQAMRLKDRDKRQHLVDTFLPPMEDPEKIEVAKLRGFLKELGEWASQMQRTSYAVEVNAAAAEQLSNVAEMCGEMLLLLETIKVKATDYANIEPWINFISGGNRFKFADAQVGSRCILDDPAKVISRPERTLWMGFEGGSTPKMECSFLSPTERDTLESERLIVPWEEYQQRRYQRTTLATPFLMTERQLIVVVCKRRNDDAPEKHPLMVMLENWIKKEEKEKGEDKLNGFVVECPELDQEKVETVDNYDAEAEIRFDHADLIKWPESLSPTTIDALIDYPFDYLMQNLLHIEEGKNVKMAHLSIVLGNVAHAVIEHLFAPRDGKRTATPEEIQPRIEKEFKQRFKEAVEAKGAILQLTENHLQLMQLEGQLRNNLDVLLEIIRENKLKVTSCEQKVEGKLDLGSVEGKRIEKVMSGRLDMTLEDEDHCPVIFDFKWTSLKKRYYDLIRKNRAIQLELYRAMLSQKEKMKVERVAYFVMPAAQLYSNCRFKGKNCIQPVKDVSEIMSQIKASIFYRLEQLSNGIAETNGELEEFQYYKDTAYNNLLPLEPEDNDKNKDKKKESKYSNYKLFNRRQQS